MRDKEKKKVKNERFIFTLNVVCIITFCNFLLFVIELCSGKERGQLYVYSLSILMRFWSNYGFQISFGYIAFWAIIPTVGFNNEIVKKYYLYKKADFLVLTSTVYLFVSFFASLFYAEIIKRQDFLYLQVNGIIAKIVMPAITLFLMFITVVYVFELSVIMKDFLKYMRMGIDDLCDEIASKKGVTNNEELKNSNFAVDLGLK